MFEGACNAEVFNEWLKRQLCPRLNGDHLVVMDNAALGLYILGKVDESAMLPFARSPENMTIVLYFMAIGDGGARRFFQIRNPFKPRH